MKKYSFWYCLTARTVWVRAIKISIPVGLLQDSINQGNHWLTGNFTTEVILKSILTPIVTLLVALFSAASTYQHMSRVSEDTKSPS